MKTPESFLRKPDEKKPEVSRRSETMANSLRHAALGGVLGGLVTILNHNPFVQTEKQKDPSSKDPVFEEEKNFNDRIGTLKNHAEFIGEAGKDSLGPDIEILSMQKDWVREKMDDPAYSERAERYEHLSANDIGQRRARLDNAPVLFFNEETLGNTHSDPSADANNQSLSSGHQIISIATKSGNLKEGNPTLVHESQHASTAGSRYMSDYAKGLYKKAFLNMEDSVISKPRHDYANPTTGQSLYPFIQSEWSSETEETLHSFGGYMGDPTELDARKKAFEFELEKNGIKKYGDPFTDEVLKTVLEKLKKGFFTDNSIQFLNHIKPEYLKRVMNTIAEEGSGKGSDSDGESGQA